MIELLKNKGGYPKSQVVLVNQAVTGATPPTDNLASILLMVQGNASELAYNPTTYRISDLDSVLKKYGSESAVGKVATSIFAQQISIRNNDGYIGVTTYSNEARQSSVGYILSQQLTDEDIQSLPSQVIGGVNDVLSWSVFDEVENTTTDFSQIINIQSATSTAKVSYTAGTTTTHSGVYTIQVYYDGIINDTTGGGTSLDGSIIYSAGTTFNTPTTILENKTYSNGHVLTASATAFVSSVDALRANIALSINAQLPISANMTFREFAQGINYSLEFKTPNANIITIRPTKVSQLLKMQANIFTQGSAGYDAITPIQALQSALNDGFFSSVIPLSVTTDDDKLEMSNYCQANKKVLWLGGAINITPNGYSLPSFNATINSANNHFTRCVGDTRGLETALIVCGAGASRILGIDRRTTDTTLDGAIYQSVTPAVALNDRHYLVENGIGAYAKIKGGGANFIDAKTGGYFTDVAVDELYIEQQFQDALINLKQIKVNAGSKISNDITGWEETVNLLNSKCQDFTNATILAQGVDWVGATPTGADVFGKLPNDFKKIIKANGYFVRLVWSDRDARKAKYQAYCKLAGSLHEFVIDNILEI